MSEQKQQYPTSAEHGIYEISEEDLESVIGGAVGHLTMSPQHPRHLVRQQNGLYLNPSPNNPTAGDLYDKNGKHVGIAIGNCGAGPC